MANGSKESWTLPSGYLRMTSREQAGVLRACILRFLKHNPPASKSIIVREIGAPNRESVQKALDYLSQTKQIYSMSFGGRDSLYAGNGKLGHPLLQGRLVCGGKEYHLRTYEDRISGKNLVITEYHVGHDRQKRATGGIRMDFVDMDSFLGELQRILEMAKELRVIDRGLVAEGSASND